MAIYTIPEEIRSTNLLLNGMGPVEAEGDVLTVLREYDSIIRVQKEGILKLREDKIRQRGFNAKEKGLVRVEGKEYVVQDGDVILFRFNV